MSILDCQRLKAQESEENWWHCTTPYVLAKIKHTEKKNKKTKTKTLINRIQTWILLKVNSPSSTNFLSSSFPVNAITCTLKKTNLVITFIFVSASQYASKCGSPRSKPKKETSASRITHSWCISSNPKKFWNWFPNIFIVQIHINKDNLEGSKKKEKHFRCR